MMGYHFDSLFFLISSILARVSFSSWASRALVLSLPLSKGANGMRESFQAVNCFNSSGVRLFTAAAEEESEAADFAGVGSAFSALVGSAFSAAGSALAGLGLAAGFSGYSSSSALAAGFFVLAALGAGSSYLAGALDGAVFFGASSYSSSEGATFFCSWSLRLRVAASSTNKTRICKFFISFLIQQTLEQPIAQILQIETASVIFASTKNIICSYYPF